MVPPHHDRNPEERAGGKGKDARSVGGHANKRSGEGAGAP